MFSVLLVDDEYMILLGLKKIINWELLAVTKIFCATNGKEALEILKNNEIDILISDVSMPIMDGLELIKEVGLSYPTVKKIILSGYSEFDYARKAITLGVENYLLKPVDKVELFQSIECCIANIEGTISYVDSSASNELWEMSFMRWLYHQISEESFLERLSLYNKEYSFLEYYFIFYKIEDEKIIKQINSNTFLAKVQVEKSYNALCIGVNSINDLNNLLSDYNDINLLISNAAYDINMLPKIFKQAKDNLLFFLAKNTIKHRYLGILLNKDDILLPRLADDYFTKFLIQRDLVSAKLVCDNMISYLLLKDCFKPNQIIEYINSIYNQFLKYSIKLGYQNNLEMDEAIYRFKRGLEDLFSYQEIIDFINNTISDLFLRLPDLNPLHPLTIKIKKYINENYTKEINVSMFAQLYGMNAAYLGQIFLNDMNLSISNYLNYVRLDKAYELIVHSEDTISEIAYNNGFNDVSYFYKKFKDKYGIAPKKLRKR